MRGALPLLLLGMGCAHGRVGPPYRGVEQFRIERGGRAVAGLAVVHLDEERAVLQALSPAGVAIFTLVYEDGRRRAEGADPAWARVLERVPFERDLSLVHRWSCGGPPRCRVAGGLLLERRSAGTIERRWRGPGGPARARIEGRRARVVDRRRGYTLTLVLPGAGEPEVR